MKSLTRLGALLLMSMYLSLSTLPVVAFASTSFATPTTGTTPLTVTFTSPYGYPQGAVAGSVSLNFDDGSQSQVVSCSNTKSKMAGHCDTPVVIKHVYTDGIYTPTLKGLSSLPGQKPLLLGTATITAGSRPACRLKLNTTSIPLGGSVTLSWSSIHATGGAITNVGNVGPSGTKNLLPSSAQYTTYIGSFTGPLGTANCSATVQVVFGNGGGNTNVETQSATIQGYTDGTQAGTLQGGMVEGSTIFTDSTGALQGNTNGTQIATLQDAAANGAQTVTLQDTSANGTQTVSLQDPNANKFVTAKLQNTPVPAGGDFNPGGGGTPSQPSALVSCGYGVFTTNNVGTDGNLYSNSTGCQACNLAQLIQSIINFLIGLSIPIAAALFAWAGILYFTSAGDHHKIDQAKGLLKNALIGFAIAIGAWLVVNTVLHTIFNQGEFAGGSWFTISCVAGSARPVSGSISDVLTKVLGNSPVTNVPLDTGGTGFGGGGYSCPANTRFDPTIGGCIDNSTGECAFAGCGVAPSGTGSVPYAAAQQLQARDNAYNALWSACDNGDEASCTIYKNLPDTGSMTAAGKTQLQALCDTGNNTESCNALIGLNNPSTLTLDPMYLSSAGIGGVAGPSSIAQAASNYYGQDTSAGPGNEKGPGWLACAWAVNNVLRSEGITPIDGNSVENMQQVLDNGRGTPVGLADAQGGDIVIWRNDSGSVSHVGICYDASCSQVVSNSSSSHSFTNVSSTVMSGVQGKIYRVNK